MTSERSLIYFKYVLPPFFLLLVPPNLEATHNTDEVLEVVKIGVAFKRNLSFFIEALDAHHFNWTQSSFSALSVRTDGTCLFHFFLKTIVMKVMTAQCLYRCLLTSTNSAFPSYK